MADEEQKKIFSRNLNNYLLSNNRTQKEVADAIGVSHKHSILGAKELLFPEWERFNY